MSKGTFSTSISASQLHLLSQILDQLEAEVIAATQRADRSSADLREAADVVNESRTKLEMYRQGVFDLVLLRSGHGVEGSLHLDSESPPTYEQR